MFTAQIFATSTLVVTPGIDYASLVQRSFNMKLAGLEIAPTYWQAAVIVFLLFLLLFTLARLRYLYIHWSFGKSSMAMVFWGFLLAMILEGFLILSGRTMLTEVLGWKNAPKPISTALDLGRSRLIDVLGVADEIPTSNASTKPTYQSVVGDYQTLHDNEKENVRLYICEP